MRAAPFVFHIFICRLQHGLGGVASAARVCVPDRRLAYRLGFAHASPVQSEVEHHVPRRCQAEGKQPDFRDFPIA
jgi:hypothetical protein